jgi:hypothetical protein
VKRRIAARAAIAAAGALAVAAGSAGAHPGDLYTDDGFLNSALEEHQVYGHGAEGSVPGRMELPSGPREEGLKLIGKTVNTPEFGELGRVADVSAKGHFAYLTMFYEPQCGRGGVQIVDISDPSKPEKRGFIPSHVDTYSGEGSQVVRMDSPSFKGDLLVYQNEWCPQTTNGVGGISLVDVSNPDQPKKLVEGAGDFTKKSGAQSGGVPQTKANQTHSAFAWKSQGDDRWYVVLVDDLEEPDVDILDITNPSRPFKVAEWNLDSTAQTGPNRPHGDAVFSHDMVVKKIGEKDVMLMSYWDGGYVKLDVTDPTVTDPKIMADTDFLPEDPANEIQITPEGNAHQAEFTRDNQFFFATDEDFNPFRVQAKITAGPYAGTDFTAIQGSDAKPIDDTTSVVGDTHFVGLGCSAIPAAGAAKIAVIERGVCDFQVKIDLAKAAGYTSVIVFNRTGVDGCETLINMLAVTDIPAIFVSRKDGFRILGASLDGYTCDSTAAATGTAAPSAPRAGQPVSIASVFDGWGYTHMYKTKANDEKKLEQVDFYSPPENQDPDLASDFGDLTVHEVATDPDENLVYISHYALGMRVLSYDKNGLEEVGAFVEKGGSNYWGVEVHKMGGKKYILGSDRDRGLRIFQYEKGYVGDGQ